MTTRRSFFRRVAAIVAVVALAPEIAFSRKLPTPSIEPYVNADYSCVMHGVTKRVTLTSKTWVINVSMPEANYIIENYSA